MRNRKLLSDLAKVALRSSFVLHHGRAADDFQVRNFCEISQDFILHAIGEEGVVGVTTEVFEWQNRNALFR